MRESQRSPVNFRLPADVLTALRRRARRDGVSMTTVVEAALRNVLRVPTYVQRQGRVAKRGTR